MTMPKPGDVIGRRTIINVRPESDMVIFGREENGIANCGAWRTNLEEWFAYKDKVQRDR